MYVVHNVADIYSAYLRETLREILGYQFFTA